MFIYFMGTMEINALVYRSLKKVYEKKWRVFKKYASMNKWSRDTLKVLHFPQCIASCMMWYSIFFLFQPEAFIIQYLQRTHARIPVNISPFQSRFITRYLLHGTTHHIILCHWQLNVYCINGRVLTFWIQSDSSFT